MKLHFFYAREEMIVIKWTSHLVRKYIYVKGNERNKERARRYIVVTYIFYFV